jgi:succinate-acetate transporter protein
MAQDTDQGIVATSGDGLSAPVQAQAREELSRRLEQVTRVNLRPIASPLPIGFIGLAVATVLVAALNLGWIPATEGKAVAFALLAFTVPTQATATVFGMLARDGVGATGMGILTGTWGTFGLVMLTSPKGATSDALGILLIVSALCMFLVATGAALGKIVPALVLGGASLRFLTAGIYQLTASSTWETITGVVGILLGAIAIYAAYAALLEGIQGRTVLPMGRRSRGHQALEGGLAEQVVDVTHEPGVRVQL